MITTYKKTDKRGKKAAQEKNKKQDNAQAQKEQDEGASKKQQVKQMCIQQSEIIYKIINRIDDKNDSSKDQQDTKYKIKNNYAWKKRGGQKILAQANHEDVSSEEETENNEDSSDDHITASVNGSDTTKKKNDRTQFLEVEIEANAGHASFRDVVAEQADEYNDCLFGPQSNNMIEKIYPKQEKDANVHNEPDAVRIHNKTISSGSPSKKPAKHTTIDNGLENVEKVQIDVVNMDNGMLDTEKKQVYVLDKKGQPRRDLKIEETEKILSKKNDLGYDQLEDIAYMPNERYGVEQTK